MSIIQLPLIVHFSIAEYNKVKLLISSLSIIPKFNNFRQFLPIQNHSCMFLLPSRGVWGSPQWQINHRFAKVTQEL